MSQIAAISPTDPNRSMTPVRAHERIQVVDILRGFAILGVLLVNMLGLSGNSLALDQFNSVNFAVVWLIKFLAQAKFYTLFSFLFGWGMAIQMERAERRGTRFTAFYVRRLLILLGIGLVHAILIWSGDILVTYALLGLLLLLFRQRSNRALLIAAAICLLLPILLYTPGPAASFRETYTQATASYRQEVIAGHQAQVYAGSDYWAAVQLRWKESVQGYLYLIFSAPHIFGMFLLGLYAGRRKILHDPSAHLPFLRRLLWGSLIVGLGFNLIFMTASATPDRFPPAYYDLALRGSRVIAGSSLCLFYLSAILLLARRDVWLARLYPLASVGRMALSNYLLQSILCTLIFYGYGLGLYGQLGPTLTLILSLVIYRLQISLSNWWLERYRFGPAEWLWRSLTYGKRHSLKPDPGQKPRPYQPPRPVSRRRIAVPDWLAFLVRRLLFTALVAVAIVYFCTLGIQLSFNSMAVERGRSVSDLAEPALQETVEFFQSIWRGEWGHISQGGRGQRDWVSVKELLADAYIQSASLLGLSIAIAAVLGIAAGGVAASRRHSLLSLPTLTLTVIGVSIPSFFLALLLQIADIKFYQQTGSGLFPIHGIGGYRRSLMPHIVPAALVLAARPLAHITRVTFVSINEIMHRDFIRTARSKGLDHRAVFLRHVLRNTSVGVLTAIVVSLRFALGSLPVVEIFFHWPGLGVLMLNAIQQREARVVAILALSLGVTFLLINTLVDLTYRLIDPRLRAPESGGGP